MREAEEQLDERQLEQQNAEVIVEARKLGRVGVLSHAVLSKSNRSVAAMQTLEYEKKSQSYATRNNQELLLHGGNFKS